MAFTENPLAFFGDFGVDATLDGAVVRGLFLQPYAEAFGYVGGSRPSFMLDAAQPVTARSSITIASTPYEVAEIQSDGTAISVLILEAVG